jgi:hypothetical protein
MIFLALIVAVLTVALVAGIGWLAWDARRIEQECREDDR